MDESYSYARRLATSLAKRHWPENDGWQPLPDLLGVLTQIDNMCTLMDDQKREIERLRKQRERDMISAYERGGAWMLENSGTPGYIAKAARDYADRMTSDQLQE